jgi:hypothetical protein
MSIAPALSPCTGDRYIDIDVEPLRSDPVGMQSCVVAASAVFLDPSCADSRVVTLPSEEADYAASKCCFGERCSPRRLGAIFTPGVRSGPAQRRDLRPM